MDTMIPIYQGANIVPIMAAINRNPNLWNEHTIRTKDDISPHKKLDDIWLRYNDWSNYNGDRDKFNSPHDSVCYPSADILNIKPIAMQIMALVGGERLGGVLIRKIPPGGSCLPHIDTGWHAEYYEKFAIQLQGDLNQSFNFDGESFSAVAGDVYWFDNSFTHWVNNDSDQDRITLIVCIKRS